MPLMDHNNENLVTPYETTGYSTLPTLALHFATALRHLITRFKRNFCNFRKI